MSLNDAQQLRYSRHLLLNDWSEATQQQVLQSHALVVGAGGLGAPALMYLASSGVGRITVIDPDEVDLTNLQRQIVHTTARVGVPKVLSAQEGLLALNPELQIQTIQAWADEALLDQWVPQVDVVLDCTDRFATRQLINRATVRHRVPLVSASAVRFDGQITVFDPRDEASPCYACIFPPSQEPEEIRCAVMGVFAPAVGIMGVMQAGEALKLLAGLSHQPRSAHESLAGRLLMLDARDWSWTTLRASRSLDCPVCGANHVQATKP